MSTRLTAWGSRVSRAPWMPYTTIGSTEVLSASIRAFTARTRARMSAMPAGSTSGTAANRFSRVSGASRWRGC